MRSLACKLVRALVSSIVVAGLLSACGGDVSNNQATPEPVATNPTRPAAAQLAIMPVAQETAVWCWAAAAQMVLQYYGLPNLNSAFDYQCGIVAAYFGQFNPTCYYNCYQCTLGIPSMDQEQIVLNGYGSLARNVGVPSRVLTSSLLFAPLSFEAVVTEISNKRPILAGISPHGFAIPDRSEHAVVIVGYDTTIAGGALIVNDPFPYTGTGTLDPYLANGAVMIAPGQYAIGFSAFVYALQWGNTLYGIQ